MKISYEWLQSFFEAPLPAPLALGERITFGAFEMESIEEKGDDTLLDIKVLPDRAHDALSHRGIAHEVSVLTGIPMKHDALRDPMPDLSPRAEVLTVEVLDAKAVPFYGAALMRNVKVGPSPSWLVSRLETIGQRSINNVVDATNYVMFELGTPLHAFDAKKLADTGGKKIMVRPAKEGEKITVLGGTEYALTPEMTVIADGNSGAALAIAGVKGGVIAEVDSETTEIVLEGAAFHPIRTRRASQALKLRTDASYRFENEIAETLPVCGLTRVVELITTIAEGTLVGYAYSEMPKQYGFTLGVSAKDVNKRLGTDISEADIAQVLTRLGMNPQLLDPIEHVTTEAPKHVGVPYKHGASVLRDAPDFFDCSSFTAWLFAHAGIVIPRISVDQYVWGTPIAESDLKPGDLIFANSGVDKIWTESQEFIPGTSVPEGIDHLGIYLGEGKVIHSTRDENGVVVQDLASAPRFSGKTVGYRRYAEAGEKRFVVTVPFERLDIRQPADLIEEIGRVRGYDLVPAVELPRASAAPVLNQNFYWSEAIRAALDHAGFTEIMTYTLRDAGEEKLLNPLAADKGYLRADLRNAIREAIDKNAYYAPLTGADDVRLYEIGRVFASGSESMHVAAGARAKAGKNQDARSIALVADAGNAIAAALGLDVAELGIVEGGEVIEFDLSSVIAHMTTPHDTYPEASLVQPGLLYSPISAYPFVLRDIAVWVPAGLESDAVRTIILEAAGNLLLRLDLFDSFTKEGRVSFAFHLVFQSSKRTLSDDETNMLMQQVSDAITKQGWEIR